MSSLLGINFGNSRHVHFQTRITIHELNNVPMVAGTFKAKWKIDHAVHQPSPAVGTHDEHLARGERLLHHKKSTSTLASQATTANEDANGSTTALAAGSVDSGSRRLSRDDASSTYSGGGGSAKAKKTASGHRFLSGLREAFHNHTPSPEDRSPRSSTSTSIFAQKQNSPPVHSPGRRSSDGDVDGGDGGNDSSAASGTAAAATPTDAGPSRREGSTASEIAPSSQSYEPRGETSGAAVSENCVVWQRQINVGLRCIVEKPRVASGGSEASSSKRGVHHHHHHHLDAAERSGGSSTPRDGQSSSSSHPSLWGQLGPSDLRLQIKAEVPTGIDSHHAHSHTSMRMGNVTINLSEFAPVPHHHHHHHHHHQQQSTSSSLTRRTSHQAGLGAHEASHHVLTRTETRRYLLQDGQTNATLKLTVEMTHVGGSKEYTVPPNKRGLLVFSSTEPTSAVESGIFAHHREQSGGADDGNSHHDDDSVDDDRDSTYADAGSVTASTSVSSGAAKAFDRYPNSIARHVRIPNSNLNAALSHKDTARAVKEVAGGGRLAFSFAGGAHHDRPPEDVIEAIFSNSDVKGLQKTPSRASSSGRLSTYSSAPRIGEHGIKARDMVR